MTTLEFYQQAFSHSAEQFISSGAALIHNIEYLAEAKRHFIASKLIEKTYNSDDICNFDNYWCTKFPHNVFVRMVAVEKYIISYKLFDNLSDVIPDEIFEIKISFMRDPNEILQSRDKITDAEKSLLKRLIPYYERRAYGIRWSEIYNLNNELCKLKHNYNVAFPIEYGYNIKDMLRSNFLEQGLKAKNTVLF